MKFRRALAKAFAFVRRDFLIASSYKLSFLLTALNSLFILTLLYFIGGMIDHGTIGLSRYGGGYFAFVLIGYGFYQYFQLAMTEFSGIIQREQVTGCLESMIGTQTSAETSILLSSMYGLIQALVHLGLIFLVGTAVFEVDLSAMNLPVVAAAFLLAVLVFVSFGILSAAFIVVLKKGDPITWLLTTMNFILGGAFFPLEQMPDWMRALSRFMPATYALDALRLGMIGGASFAEVVRPLVVLAGIGAVLFPLALSVFTRAIRKAKRDGTLVLY